LVGTPVDYRDQDSLRRSSALHRFEQSLESASSPQASSMIFFISSIGRLERCAPLERVGDDVLESRVEEVPAVGAVV